MNKKMAREIVESLPSLYPLMTADEEEAIWTVLATNSNTENDGDCISRQAAIDAFNARLGELVVGGEENAKSVEMYLNKVIEKIEALPSAQPEQNLDEWCDSCKEYDKEKHSCPRWNKVIKNTVDELKSAQPEQCEDAVSRQAAIDAIISFFKLTDYNESAYAVRTVLGDLPSAQPQRTGKWIPKDGRYYCGQCSGIAPKGIRWDFCPHCGVKMEGTLWK